MMEFKYKLPFVYLLVSYKKVRELKYGIEMQF